MFRAGDGQIYAKRVVGFPGETVELKNGVVTINGAPMDSLTYKEMELLFILLRRSPRVVRRTYLLQRLWGRQDSRALDVHILHLRQKLGSQKTQFAVGQAALGGVDQRIGADLADQCSLGDVMVCAVDGHRALGRVVTHTVCCLADIVGLERLCFLHHCLPQEQ